MKAQRILIALSVAAALGTACGFERKTTTTSNPLQPSAAPQSQSLVGTYTTQSTTESTTPTGGCTNVLWTVTSQTAADVAGTFSALCVGTAYVSGTATGHITGSALALTVTGTGTMPGVSSCPFSLSGTGTMTSDSVRVPYTGTTCLGPLSGTIALQRAVAVPTPAPVPVPTPVPTPPPAPAPTPIPTPTSPDQLDMHRATILNSPSDLASWPVTTTLSLVDIRPNGVHVEFSKQDGPGRWPDVFPPGWDEPLQYTLGMCMNIGGQWYCSAVVQFWHGLEASGGGPDGFAQNWFYDPIRWGPMSSHQPAVGETIGFFVCAGDCRNNRTGSGSVVKERTNVVLVPMPGSGGASYRF